MPLLFGCVFFDEISSVAYERRLLAVPQLSDPSKDDFGVGPEGVGKLLSGVRVVL
jgi:hypothetical protein